MSDKPEVLYVLDTTCTPRAEHRTHEIIIDGVPMEVSFQFRMRKELPYAVAMKFSHDPAWIITVDDEGKVPYEVRARKPDNHAAMALADDECIARYSELTVGALIDRAVVEPGGEKINKNVKKDDIQAFLVARRRAKKAEAGGKSVKILEPSAEAVETEEMDPEEVDAVFADQSAAA